MCSIMFFYFCEMATLKCLNSKIEDKEWESQSLYTNTQIKNGESNRFSGLQSKADCNLIFHFKVVLAKILNTTCW